MPTTQKDDAVEELTRPVIKLLIGLIGLWILRFIVARLPGVDTRIPETPIVVGHVAFAVITLIMVGIIVNFGREIEPRLNAVLKGPTDVIQDISESVKYIAYILAIVLAYDGLDDVVVPFLFPDPGRIVYDVAFLLAALVPTVIVALRIFSNVDEITDVLTQEVKSATVDQADCPSCTETIRTSQDFCPSCGEDVSDLGASDGALSACPECESDVQPGMEFCGSCGSQISASD